MGIAAAVTRPRRVRALLALVSAAIGLLALLAPAAFARSARDGSGGTALSGSGAAGTGAASGSTNATAGSSVGSSSTAANSNPNAAGVIELDAPLQASGAGITLTVSDVGTLRHVLKLAGSAPVADDGSTIDIEIAPELGSQTWTEVTSATVGSNGAFSSVWLPTQSTTVELKAVLATSLTSASSSVTSTDGGGGLPDAATAATQAAVAATSTVTIPIFADGVATFYGPGLWGHRTACGQVLRRGSIGVASRTLKCGTMVAVYYRGRELAVPVIDRGPFANHASWDLTLATARLLGIVQTSTIGTLAPAPAVLLAAARAGS